MIISMSAVGGCMTAPTIYSPPYALSSCPPLPAPAPCVQAPTASAPSAMNEQALGGPAAAVATPAPSVAPLFSLQRVVATDDYQEFVAVNEKQAQNCRQGAEGCDVALFNLGFAYAYEASPYRNLSKAAMYFEDLSTRYPKSPYALPGRVWRTLIRERLTLESDLRTVKTHLRSKDVIIRTLQEQMQRLQELEIEMQEKERELLQSR